MIFRELPTPLSGDPVAGFAAPLLRCGDATNSPMSLGLASLCGAPPRHVCERHHPGAGVAGHD
jgi:hypothetical protein